MLGALGDNNPCIHLKHVYALYLDGAVGGSHGIHAVHESVVPLHHVLVQLLRHDLERAQLVSHTLEPGDTGRAHRTVRGGLFRNTISL